ncbi:hypothetical protein EUX98_g6848 [Antrodiella citrinella]|uniref:DUF5110 domain-containing protein n=1 Tax=Antrodiella citrinella TaxID=2447956 RepID=A0A4S4MQG0_9APHY|nr:hypothetical protein EUX98_g6848 [Antrodiella citrinella]
MLVRWYHVGAFSPFFRAHAHIDTKRREPYLLDEPYKGMVKEILRRRYAMLPIWYTAFREASTTGLPVARPHYVAFPKDEAGFSIDDQYMVGSSGLLVKPVTEKGAKEASVYFPANEIFYDYNSYSLYRTSTTEGKTVTVAAELHQVPLFIRGGSVVPTRERPRRSASVMRYDPFTLRIALDPSGSARGELYLDDGVTFKHEQGQIVWREILSESSGKGIKLSSHDLTKQHLSSAVDSVALSTYDPANEFALSLSNVRVEKVIVLGLAYKPSSVRVGGKELEWEYVPGVASSGKKEGTSSQLTIKDPAVKISSDWEIVVLP